MTTFKYFLVFVTFILLTTIECALKKDYNNIIVRPFYKYSISNKNNQNIQDFVNLDKYSSYILYIQKRPSSLSKEKYAEKIINLQNNLDLPKLFKSEKNEIIDFLKEKNSHRKQKRQTTTPDRDVVITVTVYGKGKDIIIIKEVIPEVPNIDVRFHGRDYTTPKTFARQPPVGSWDWFPTLRTISVYGPNSDQSPAATTSRPWYDYRTESTTTSTTPRPWNWFEYTTESITTTTSTPTPWVSPYSEEPSSGTQEQPIEGEEEKEKTEETSTSGLFNNWFNWNPETTEAATTTTTTTTTLRSPLWNTWFSPLNPSSETTTSTTSNDWDNWIVSTTQQSRDWDWNTTPEIIITTTTTESPETTTRKSVNIFSWFG